MKKLLTILICLPGWAQAQQTKTDTISTWPGYANQVWYSLSKGVVATQDKDNWDIAFETKGFTASIMLNQQKGILAWQTATAPQDWTQLTDTVGMFKNWKPVYNADTSWSYGALNQNAAGEFDLGWGEYNQVTHIVTGTKVYVLQMPDKSFRKLKIDKLQGGAYSFTTAAFNGANEKSTSINKTDFTTKNLVYYSFETQQILDREPAASDWDFTFTKYMAFIPQAYGVTGIVSNTNTAIARVAKTDTATTQYAAQNYSYHINQIGYNWKTYDMAASKYSIEDSLVFFVKTQDKKVWKVICLGFEGSSTGKYVIQKRFLQDIAAVPIVKNADKDFSVWPNPAVAGGCINVSNTFFCQAALWYNNMGQLIAQQTITEKQLRLPKVEAGNYWLQIGAHATQIMIH